MRRSIRHLAQGLIVALLFGSSAGIAQDPPAQPHLITNPAEKLLVAPGGVDMRTGRYAQDETDLSIGNGASNALALKRTMVNPGFSIYGAFGNFSHNWDITVTISLRDTDGDGRATDYRAIIRGSGLAATFESRATDTGYLQKSANGSARLTYSGGARDGPNTTYTYTTEDGTVYVFRDCSSGFACGRVASMTLPDGTVFRFTYASTSTSGTNNVPRLSHVVSSQGYALLFEGEAAGPWPYVNSVVTKACMLNLAATPIPPDWRCPANAQATASYNYDGLFLTAVTAPDGTTTSFDYDQVTYNGPMGLSGYRMKFIKPGQIMPWLTNIVTMRLVDIGREEYEIHPVVIDQKFADGRSYSYYFDGAPGPFMGIAGGEYSDNIGRNVIARYDFPIMPGTGFGQPCYVTPCQAPTLDDVDDRQQTSGPVEVTDALGRTTRFDYCDQQALVALPPTWTNRCYVQPEPQVITDPEGIKSYISYQGRNPTRVRRVAKPGSGLADIVTSATYTCPGVKCANKPTSTTDARGNVTTFTYDTGHGGILTQTDPAVGGISPVKRFGYVQRYAWISNGGGGYTRSTDPVWLLATVKTCRTTATSGDACTGGAADEVVTSYDYGPDSGPNTLLLRGTVVTADGVSLRTCYGYDALGNRISETGPRAGLTVCP